MMKKVYAFDLDQTLIQGNSSANYCRYLCQKNILPFTTLVHSWIYAFRHRFLGMTYRELHHSIFNRILKGKPLELFEKYVEKFARDYLSKSLYMPAYNLLRKAQEMGHYTVILSTSPSFLVKQFASLLKVNDYFATEYTVDEQKRFDVISKILEGRDKANHILEIARKLGTFLEDVTACSDSVYDLEFLKAAGNPVAVNPDKKLRAISLKNKWQII